MQKRIVINAGEIETRVALLEGNQLAELQIEGRDEASIVGNIYKGRVLRVLPGMQAAFVDVGLEKAAFMHVSDFTSAPVAELDEGAGESGEAALSMAAYADDADAASPDADTGSGDAELDSEPASALATTSLELEATEGPVAVAATPGGAPTSTETSASEAADAQLDPPSPEAEEPPRVAIEDLLKKGQEILVQISKEPIGSKGARITSHISLPGRYVVYMPTTEHIGVSRRIEDEKERKRLRDIVASGRGKVSGGFIVRTACEGVSKREIVADMRFLSKLWSSIFKKSTRVSAPTLLHEDLDIILRAVRDLFTADVAEVVVDRATDHKRIIDFVDDVLQPRLKSRVVLSEEVTPVFDRFGIEAHAHRALERRVWLKSGGYLVFDQTEALTTVDVNTGRFVGKKTQEETVLKVNLEAARVAVDQLRLRNIGGIIIIDFIDMEKATNRKKVSEALAEAVKRDKARTNILRISELGLVQMTRKRTRENLRQVLTSPCPTCSGDGRLRSIETMAADAIRAARRAAAQTGTKVEIRVAPDVAGALTGPLGGRLSELEERYDLRISVVADRTLQRGEVATKVLEVREGRPNPAQAPPIEAALGERPEGGPAQP